MSLLNDFNGKRVRVNGGTKAIGLAIVKRMQERGAQVVTTARTPTDDRAPGGRFIRADIGTSLGSETVAGAILAQLGGVDRRQQYRRLDCPERWRIGTD